VTTIFLPYVPLLHDLIVTIDKDSNLVFVNDAAVDFWGKSRKKLLGTHFNEYLHPDDIEKAVAAIQDLIENNNQVKSFILRTKSHKGIRNVAWNGVAIFDDEGNYVRAQATGKDLTDLLRAEEKLQASEERFRYFLDIMLLKPFGYKI
jgi:PAS domain S-box-containing protein